MTCFLQPQVNLPVATSIGVPTAMRRSTGENCLGRGEGRKSRAPNIFERGGAAKLVPARWRFSANQNRLGPSANKNRPKVKVELSGGARLFALSCCRPISARCISIRRSHEQVAEWNFETGGVT